MSRVVFKSVAALFVAGAVLAGCGGSGGSSNSTPLTASDFTVTLESNQSVLLGDWYNLSNPEGGSGDANISATVSIDGSHGGCVVSEHNLTYTKSDDSNETDVCVLSITDGKETVEIDANIEINIFSGIFP